MTQNLAAVGTCLLVTADHVTIDLNGFVLSGDGTTGTGVGAGPGSTARFDIAVRNGTVTGFLFGVNFSFVTGAMVAGMRIIDNFNGLIGGGESGPGGSVIGNTVNGNANIGIVAGKGSTVTGNTAIDTGIVALEGSTVSGNTVRGATTGILVVCTSNVIGNTATDSGLSNISFQGAGCTAAHNLAP